MAKISEAQRRVKAWEMVCEISADAQSTNPKRDWKESHEAVCHIFQIAHSIMSPECRKNHKAWSDEIDAAIRAEASARHQRKEK